MVQGRGRNALKMHDSVARKMFSQGLIPIVTRDELIRPKLYRGVPHQSITFGFGLSHIRFSHLVQGLHTLEYHTWSRARTH